MAPGLYSLLGKTTTVWSAVRQTEINLLRSSYSLTTAVNYYYLTKLLFVYCRKSFIQNSKGNFPTSELVNNKRLDISCYYIKCTVVILK